MNTILKLTPIKLFCCLAFILGSCRPSSTSLNTKHMVVDLQNKRSAKALPILATSGSSKPKVQTAVESVIIPESFTPSDRIWGHLSLPAEAVGKIHHALTDRSKQFRMVIYGDSHTQGGFLGETVAKTLGTHFAAHQAELSPSPGFITVDHPIRSEANVELEGIWIRQNWLYASDHGSFGPLGISFVTQDRTAQMRLKTDLSQKSKITVYFERTGQELPFCLRVVGAQDSEQCHYAGEMREGETRLGKLHVHLAVDDELSLHLEDGSTITKNLMKKRMRSLKALKRKRSRLRRRFPRMKRSQIAARIKPPSYAKEPHIIYPNRPHLKIFGFQVDTLSNVQIHSMGVRGATVWSPVRQGDDTMEDWLQAINPHMIALWYGTNTAARESGSLSVYEDRFRTLVKKLKLASPTSACLVILPPDFGRRDPTCFLTKRQRRLLKRKSKHPKFLDELSHSRYDRVCNPDKLLNHNKRGRHRFPVPEVKNDHQWQSYKDRCTYRAPKYLTDLVEIQRKIGLEQGCAVYDTLSEMGGIGSIKQWACLEPDRLAQFDLVHLSPRGYSVLGQRIAEGILSVLDKTPTSPPSLDYLFIEEPIATQ